MKEVIVVIGATGAQGKGVVNALVEQGKFTVRAVTRNPEKYAGKATEIVKADLQDEASLVAAFKGAYGVFLVTNFWEGADEVTQLKTAVRAAQNAGIQHFVWSTLPNVQKISDDAFDVPHFTLKAEVDDVVKSAAFTYHTFVQAPFYFQNLTGMLAPQPQADGTKKWTLNIDPSTKGIHMGDINDLGKVVAGAFAHPEKVGKGAYLSVAPELNSFKDLIAVLNKQGHQVSYQQVPSAVFATFFEGAKEIAEMFSYFEKYTYMGPDSDERIALAKSIATSSFTTFENWAKANMPV